MEEARFTKILRVLAVLLGLFMFGMAAFMYLALGNSDLWVGVILGPIFFLFGILGKNKFAKLLPGASRNVF
ncbi:hypothetical protein [Zhongshania sp.]|jgi:hypothetical protein|uniref:hypothetical protein n=1 Tax=Zhongshania sp. TaxID=1971902 RepID=UPI0039E27401